MHTNPSKKESRQILNLYSEIYIYILKMNQVMISHHSGSSYKDTPGE